MGQALETMNIQNDEIFFGNERFLGVAMVELLPTSNRFPFVMARMKDGTNISANCRTCSERKNKVGPCGHSNHERSFTGTWTSYILNAALRYGYKIIQV